MKKMNLVLQMALGVVGVVVGANASASPSCPDLSGAYARCEVVKGSADSLNFQRIDIAQSVNQEGASVYKLTTQADPSTPAETEEFIADGVARSATEKDPALGLTIESIAKVSCLGSQLGLSIQVSIPAFGTGADVKARLELDSAGNLIQNYTTQQLVGGQPQGEAEQAEIRCYRE